jgi:hypothetical protein
MARPFAGRAGLDDPARSEVGGVDVFISHVEEDREVALELADALDAAGYSTWCYERDTIPGPSYLLQTSRAIEQSRAVVVLISPDSLGSHQVTSEVVRAHEEVRPFIPLLLGISREEFGARQPEWREAIGSAATLDLPPGGVPDVVPRIVDGLTALGVRPHEGGAPRPKLSYLAQPEVGTVPVGGRRRLRSRYVAAAVVSVLVVVAAVVLLRTLGGGEGKEGGSATSPVATPTSGTSPSATAPTSPTPTTPATEPLPTRSAADTPVKTLGGQARVTARTETRFCPIGGGACQTANPGRVFVFLDVRPWGTGELRYDNEVSLNAFGAHLGYQGIDYAPNENHTLGSGGSGFTSVFPGVPDAVVGRDVELRWPGNPALRLHVKR